MIRKELSHVPLYHSSVPSLWGLVKGPVPKRCGECQMPMLWDAGVSGKAGAGSAAAGHGGLWARRGYTGPGRSGF